MANESLLDAEAVRDLLDYDLLTGCLVWRFRRGGGPVNKMWNARFCGKPAGHQQKTGYVAIGINGHMYRSHRLAWLHFYGEWPKHQIDHINGIRSDNRIENIRQATSAENCQNKIIQNTSGYPGVHLNSRLRKWIAKICINSQRIYLGVFDKSEDAYAAYCAAKSKYHQFQPLVPQRSMGGA